MENWKTCELGDLITFQRGHDLPKSEVVQGKYPVAGSNAVIGYHNKFTTKAPSITIGRSGNIGNPHFYETDFWAHNTTLYIKEFKDSYPKFIYYLLKTLDFSGYNSGSAVPSLNRNFIHPMKVFVPESIEEQKAIAKILSSLDDKIELNRRINETLEATAHNIFKAWFVDFEPVRANLENRASASASPDIFKLFPSEFENGLPKGWEEKELKEVFEINPFRKLAKGQMAKFLDMANVPTSGHSISKLSEREFSSGMKFIAGDTLLARITPCLENGKTAFVDFLDDGEVGFGSTEFIVLRPKNLPEYFAYLLCRTDEFRAFAIQSMTGTSGRQRVQTDRLATYKIAVPSEINLIADSFGEILTPIVNRISRNSIQTKVLEEIRDSLLPRLISGKIRVGEVEKEIGQSV